MKKRKALIVSILSVAAALVCFFGCKSAGNGGFSAEYTANYGEWYLLPSADEAKAYRENGEEIPVCSNKIFIDDVADCTLKFKLNGKKYESILKINKNVKPNVYISEKIVFGSVGNRAEFPAATAFDGVRTVPVTGKLYSGENEVDISGGFIPEAAGEYEYVAAATGGSGASYSEKLPVYVEETAAQAADRIASFDKPYGVNHFAKRSAGVFYSSEIRFEGESGSTGFQFGQGGSEELALCNLQKEDVTAYDALSFYIYNDSDSPVAFSLNWTSPYGWITLPSRVWKEIFIDLSVYNENFNMAKDMRGTLSKSNITGTPFIIECSDIPKMKYYDSVYFSSIRGVNYLGADGLKNLAEEAVESGEVTQREITLFERSYERLGDEEKQSVGVTDAFEELKLNKIIESTGVERKEGKIAYFDSETALIRQLGSISWQARPSFRVTKEKQYGGENTAKDTAKKTKSAGSIVFTYEEPFVRDLSAYDYITFGFYFEYDRPLYYFNSDEKTMIGTQKKNIRLEPGVWNTVNLPLNGMKSIKNKAFWVYSHDDNGVWLPFESDFVFYVSSVYAKKLPQDSLCFDEDTGLMQLTNYSPNHEIGASFTYTREIAEDGRNGSVRVGAEKLKPNNTLYAGFENAAETAKTNLVYRMGVYYESQNSYSVIFTGRHEWSNKGSAELMNGQWTDVYFIVKKGTALQDYALMFIDSDWKFDKADSVYLSAAECVGEESETGLSFDSEFGDKFVTAREKATVEYSSDIRYAGQKHSVKISASEKVSAQIRANFSGWTSFVAAGDKIRTYEFNVWNGTGENFYVYFMKKDKWGTITHEQKMEKKAWTKGYFILPAGENFAQYQIALINGSWNLNAGDGVYFSSFELIGEQDDNTLALDGELAKLHLRNKQNASIGHSDEKAYGNESGSAEIGAAADTKGNELILDFAYAYALKKDENNAKTYKFYAYYEGERSYAVRFMKKDKWDTLGDRQYLKSGEWTEITITLAAGESIEEYEMMIVDDNWTFGKTDKIYLSAMRAE